MIDVKWYLDSACIVDAETNETISTRALIDIANKMHNELNVSLSRSQTKTVADAVEQEGEKWTHTYVGGHKCKVIATDGDDSWVLTEYGTKVTEYTSSLKPIKTQITAKQAWNKLIADEMTVADVLEQYDII